MSHTCPINGCGAVISDSKLMCVEHWSQVPSMVQKAVNRSWAGTRAKRELQVQLDSIKAYRKHRQEAIDAVNALGVLR